jgi:hypothetical protein
MLTGWRSRAPILALALIPGACDVNIGGAGYDPKATAAEAENYPTYMAAHVREEVFTGCDDNVKQHFHQMFRSFRESYPQIDRAPVTLKSGIHRASYRNSGANVFVLTEGDRTLIRETLPAAFYMHPVSMGIHTIDGRPIIMITDKSRATTGRYFVAIYGADGSPYYRRTLGTGQVWDLAASERHIDIVGRCERRRITFG